jgi:hypothetical protein
VQYRFRCTGLKRVNFLEVYERDIHAHGYSYINTDLHILFRNNRTYFISVRWAGLIG